MRYMLMTLACLIVAGCSGDVYYKSANEQVLFTVNKSDNRNFVNYAVRTNGECGVRDVVAYWTMAEEGGHLEELLSIEEDYYGVKDLKISGDTVSFHVAALPEKVVAVLDAEEEEVEEESLTITCTYSATTTIDGEEAVVESLHIQNKGLSVTSLTIVGLTAGGDTVTETIVP